MRNRHVGYLVIGIAAVFFFIVLSFNNALKSIVNVSCTHGVECPMHFTLFTQEVISYGLVGLLVLVGIVVAFFLKDQQTTIIHNNHEKKKLTQEEKNEKLEALDEDEKKVMQIIMREEGSVYQSDVIKETGLSKVKVSRLLDKIEGKGLIERKRRGMTNVIVLK